MGHRTLKRVGLDFDWPFGKVWEGYINPYPGRVECPHCCGSGLNPASKQIQDDFHDNVGFGIRWRYQYGTAPNGSRASRPPWKVVGDCRAWQNNITQDEVDALVKAERLWDFTRVPLNAEQQEDVRKKMAAGGNSWLPYHNGHNPTAEEVNSNLHRVGALGGHDSINQCILVETRCKRLGVWGNCKICKGQGYKFPKGVSRHKHNAWRKYEPPAGPGFQLWETVSEGSPISPVFATAEELAHWCSLSTAFAPNETTSYETLLEMFREDSVEVGSMIVATAGYVGSAANMPAHI